MERIDKLLSSELNITRSRAKSLIKTGRVKVNGIAVRSADTKINTDTDEVEADGKALSFRKFVYIMMNKPAGVISSSDGRKTGEQTVIDILPEEMRRKNLFPAGRLDKDTTGFLLITDDGVFAHNILSPKKHISKTYVARLDKPFDDRVIHAFECGVELGNEKCMPADLKSLNSDNTLAQIVLKQGMYHQIKRMFLKFGITVLKLKRISMGGLLLDEKLEPGACRYISENELALITSCDNMPDFDV